VTAVVTSSGQAIGQRLKKPLMIDESKLMAMPVLVMANRAEGDPMIALTRVTHPYQSYLFLEDQMTLAKSSW